MGLTASWPWGQNLAVLAERPSDDSGHIRCCHRDARPAGQQTENAHSAFGQTQEEVVDRVEGPPKESGLRPGAHDLLRDERQSLGVLHIKAELADNTHW
ncbi:MAG: hypothetical protein ACI9TF_001279 [Paracrocinitomix sp.]|jgi:hypothetical protein